MTFNEIALLIQDRDASWGCWMTPEQANERAAYEILEGFRDFDDALDLYDARAWLETFREREAVLFTLYGYEVSAGALEAAIRHQKALDADEDRRSWISSKAQEDPNA